MANAVAISVILRYGIDNDKPAGAEMTNMARLDAARRDRLVSGQECPRCGGAEIHAFRWQAFECGACNAHWTSEDFSAAESVQPPRPEKRAAVPIG